MRTLAIAAALAAACGGSGPGDQPDAGAVTLQSGDGQIELEIPAGALPPGANAAIGPGSGNAPPGAVGSSFSLTPEGLTFAKPAKLTVHTSAAGQGFLGIAFRDAQGNWQAVRGVTVDASAGTVSAPITHFSEWALFQDLLLEPDHAAILTGQTLALHIAMLASPQDLAGSGDPIPLP